MYELKKIIWKSTDE